MIAGKEEQEDWEVTSEGLYIATRDFLIRRGYCCASRCRNCPYINWCSQPAWQPIPAERVKRARVSPRSIAAAQALLQHHQQQLCHSAPTERKQHQEMIMHYTRLLERWKESC